MLPPLRKPQVHNPDKAVIVVALDEMHEFVGNDVFETLHGLLGQFEVQPDATGFGVASAPSGFHFLYAPVCELDAQDGVPFLDKRWNQFFELLTIPMVQNSVALPGIGFWPHMEFERGLITQLNTGNSIEFDHTQAIPPP